MHVVHAITRPAELRYDDLLRKISSLSHNLTEISLMSSHAEQRDLHKKVQHCSLGQQAVTIGIERLTALVLQMKDSITTEHAINASARIKIFQSLSELQLNQFLSLLSVTVLLDPTKTFQASLFLQNRRRLRPSDNGLSFWLDPKMQAWNRSKNSSLIMINGTHRLRFHTKDFCTDSISLLCKSQTPVIWALKSMDIQAAENDNIKDTVSTIELLKYLISQAVRINEKIHTDAALIPRLKAYLSATTEEDWFNILAFVLQGIPILYIIIDVELLHHSLADFTEDFSWPEAFLKLFSGFADRNINTVIRVAMVSYGSSLFRKPMSDECRNLIIPVGGKRPVQAPMGKLNGRSVNSILGEKQEVGMQAGLRYKRSKKRSRRPPSVARAT